MFSPMSLYSCSRKYKTLTYAWYMFFLLVTFLCQKEISNFLTSFSLRSSEICNWDTGEWGFTVSHFWAGVPSSLLVLPKMFPTNLRCLNYEIDLWSMKPCCLGVCSPDWGRVQPPSAFLFISAIFFDIIREWKRKWW